MSYLSPIFILANPQIGENIGMVMRAMLNFQCTELRLINPRPNWSQQKAINTAAGAAQTIMPNMKTYTSIESATEDIHYLIATTARTRNLNIPELTPKEAVKNIHEKLQQEQKSAILFGSEQNGLNNDDIAKAHAITNFHTNSDFPSLNLAAAVMLMAYEFSNLQDMKKTELPIDDSASLKDINFFCDKLDEELYKRDFYRSLDMRPHMRRNIRVMFQRMQPSEQDIRTWHGIIKSLMR